MSLCKTRHWCQRIPQLVSRFAAVPAAILSMSEMVPVPTNTCLPQTRYRYQRYAIATLWAGSGRMCIFCWKWTAVEAPFFLFSVHSSFRVTAEMRRLPKKKKRAAPPPRVMNTHTLSDTKQVRRIQDQNIRNKHKAGYYKFNLNGRNPV